MVAAPNHGRNDVDEIILVGRGGNAAISLYMNKMSSSGKGTVMFLTYRGFGKSCGDGEVIAP
jgi:hypothetical protein